MIDEKIEQACDLLSPRAGYARDVLRGSQRWSGSDLKGKARRFGGSYMRQRTKANEAWQSVGGCIIAVEHGLLISAVRVGQDDFGNAIYHTAHGVVTA